MAGTAMTDLKALVLTANAKSVAATKGLDLNALVVQAERLTGELTVILKQIYSFHPSSGGDAANYAAINTVIGELA